MPMPTSANTNNALLGLLIVLNSFLGFPDAIKTVIFVVLGVLIVVFALASSNFGQHGSNQIQKQ